MSESRIGWTVVGQTADVLQITATIFGVITIVLAGFGKNLFSGQPAESTVVVAAVAFGVVGLIAIATAVARNHRDNAGFGDPRLAGSRTLYIVGVLLLALAAVTAFLPALHPALVVAGCPAS